MKKILCIESEHPKIIGIAHALKAQRWDKRIPIFDLITNYKPDIIFLRPADIRQNDAVYAQEEFPNIRIVLLDDKEISHNYTLETLNLESIPYLASEFLYGSGEMDHKFEADISVFSDSLNDQHIDWITTLFEEFTIKIYGAKKLATSLYLGQLSPHEYKTVLASSSMHLVFDPQWTNNCYLNNCLPIVYDKTGRGGFHDLESLLASCRQMTESLIKIDEKDLVLSENREKITYEYYIREAGLC